MVKRCRSEYSQGVWRKVSGMICGKRVAETNTLEEQSQLDILRQGLKRPDEMVWTCAEE